MAERAEAVAADRRGAGKSAAAFRTISEVATELDVPPHVLRFWESKFAQVKPLKRGGGRRYYRPEDIDLLRRIRNLLYSDGYTIKGVQKLLRDNGGKAPESDGADNAARASAEVTDLASQRRADTAGRRAELQTLVGELESLRDQLRTGI